ncbi:hypothetical protein [Peribacillus simplex]|uniref:hypothetical protein n=1 Tax=Peribacillus simplex TaxID=1478 RepID=UPI003D27ED05
MSFTNLFSLQIGLVPLINGILSSFVVPVSGLEKGMLMYRLSHLDLSMSFQSTTMESERSTVKPPNSLHKEKTSFINWSLGY